MRVAPRRRRGRPTCAAAIDRYIRADDELSDLTTTLEEESDVPTTLDPASPTEPTTTRPIVRFVNLLVSQAIQDRASDIHIEPGEHDAARPLPHRRRAARDADARPRASRTASSRA